MKLCHIVPSLQEKHGGPSKSVRALCRALARAGHSVELLTTDPNAPREGTAIDEHENLRIRIFRRDRPQRLCLSAGLQAALAQCDADIVHHHALWLRTLHYAHRQARSHNLPLIISPRGMMSTWAWRHHQWRKQLSNALLHPGALRRATGWHATSPEEEREIREIGFTQPVCVAPNGIDTLNATEIAAAASYWREECPEVATRPTAVFYGRFHQKKRVIELIDVWLEHATPGWLLLLVGLPEDYTPAMLDNYVQKMSGTGRVKAFSGAGRPAPYAVASLFLLPSHNENFGLSVAEAMAHGVPALVTDTMPWRAVNVEQRGWCVPWSNYGPTLRAATAESAESLQSRGSRSRDWVLREYSWDRAADLLARFYESIIGHTA